MTSTKGPPEGTPVADVVEQYLEAKAKGGRSGNYRSLATAALGRWSSWLETRGSHALEDVDDDVMRAYAQELRSDVRDGELAASTANTYYATVRACLGWAVEDGILVENPAAAARATKELPEDTAEPSRQFWTADDVQALLDHVDQHVDERLQKGGIPAARGAVRDRALVSLLAFAGVRGAEIVRDYDDDRDGRQGLRWSNVDLEAGTLTVLGKSQSWEHAQLPPQAQDHLHRHRLAQQPASDDWPVFPTEHVPSLREAAKEHLDEQGWSSREIEAALEAEDIADVLRDHDAVPPAVTIRGARSVMQRLCEQADVDVDGEYLKPHGARRGLGDTLYRESAELAQSALRHSSVRTTHASYSHIDASETADEVGEIIEDAWGSRGDQSNES